MAKLFSTHGLLGQIVTVASGKGAAQLIVLLSTPLIARLFDPAHYGTAALLISLVSPLSVLATLRYERASLLPKTDDEAKKLSALALFLVTSSSALFALFVFSVYLLNAVPAWLKPLGNWVLAMPLVLLFLGVIKVLEASTTRAKRFNAIAISDVAQSGIMVAGRLLGGWSIGSSLSILVCTHLAGLLVKGAVQYKSGTQYLSQKNSIQLSELKGIAVRYSDFPVYNAPAGFVNSFSKSLPMILFGYFFTPAIVGFYAMASRLFRKPANIVASSIRSVYLRRAAEQKNKNLSLLPMFRKATGGLAISGIVPAILLMTFGTEICVLILGDAWILAGVFVEILSPLLFAILLAVPSSAVIVVFRRQALWLRVQVTVAVLRLAGCFLAVHMWNSAEAVLVMFVVIGVLSNFYVVYFARVLIMHDDRERELQKA